MNKYFLDCVATDLLQKYGTNMSRIAVVFPNKRASLFLNDHSYKKQKHLLDAYLFHHQRSFFAHNQTSQ